MGDKSKEHITLLQTFQKLASTRAEGDGGTAGILQGISIKSSEGRSEQRSVVRTPAGPKCLVTVKEHEPVCHESHNHLKGFLILACLIYLLVVFIGEKERDTEGIEFYRRMSQKRPDYAHTWYRQGNMHALNEEYQKAIDCYMKVLETRPDHVNALNNIGNAYMAKKMYKQAIDHYRKALELNPMDELAWGNRGIAHGFLGEYKEAIHCFEQALKFNDENVKVLSNMGITYFNKGEHIEARKCFSKVLEISPDDELALSCLSRMKDDEEESKRGLLSRFFS